MMISLIVSLAADRVIGIKNALPCHFPADLDWFKNNTLGKPVIMGRKTFNAIGNPLLGRHNIVLSQHPSNDSRVTWVTTSKQALTASGNAEEIMVIGGAKIYEIFLSNASRLYLTHIEAEVNGDTWFPNYKLYEWHCTFRESYKVHLKNIYNYCFEILDR